VVLTLSVSISNALEVDLTLNSPSKLEVKALLATKRDQSLSMATMVTSNVLIHLLGAKLLVSHIAQETVWEEVTVLTINVFATPVSLVSIAVCINKVTGMVLGHEFF